MARRENLSPELVTEATKTEAATGINVTPLDDLPGLSTWELNSLKRAGFTWVEELSAFIDFDSDNPEKKFLDNLRAGKNPHGMNVSLNLGKIRAKNIINAVRTYLKSWPQEPHTEASVF